MATWIAHLRIAENLLERIPSPSTPARAAKPGRAGSGQRLDPGQFAIGNIAPDSGIPDEKWEKFRPSPEVTHFKRSKSVHKDIADLEFYRDYLAEVSTDDTGRFSFCLGYFFHLITDNLWTLEVGKPTQERFSEKFAADNKFIWEVKKDWYGLDHIYVREHPDCLYWHDFLDTEAASVDLDFLPPDAVSRHLSFIKEYYQTESDEIQEMMTRPKKYLSKDEMDVFVEETSERLFSIYNILWPTPPPLNGIASALELADS
jgi:hypothetical protein